jgi:protein-tyrosine phosphatase
VGGFTDLHCHVVPGVDDGVATLEAARAALDAMRALGFARIAVTPHIRPPIYPNEPEALAARTKELHEATGFELRPGAEHFFGSELDDLVAARRALTWSAPGAHRAYLLIEVAHQQPFPLNLESVLFRWRVAGIFAILAHPERYAEVQRDPDRARKLAEAGVVLQVDLTSLGGKFGRVPRKLARAFVEDGLVAIAASDLHDAADAKAVGDGIAWLDEHGHSERLLVENPDRIWRGEPVEP